MKVNRPSLLDSRLEASPLIARTSIFLRPFLHKEMLIKEERDCLQSTSTEDMNNNSAVEALEIHKKLSFDRIPSSATTNLCLKCIERSIKSVECLEGCRFARYCFTKSIHFVSSPPVARRHKMLYYVVIRLVIRFFGYYVSEQYEGSSVFCTSSRAQEKYSSDRDSGRLRVLDLTSQGD